MTFEKIDKDSDKPDWYDKHPEEGCNDPHPEETDEEFWDHEDFDPED